MNRVVVVVACLLVSAAGAAWVGCGSDETETPDDGSGATGSGGTGNASSSGGSGVGGENEVPCNPVTNEPCGPGEGCDAGDGNFICYADGNIGAVCEPCDADASQFCQGTLACVGTTCMRFCCTDADCGTGTCAKTDRRDVPIFDFAPDVGLCLVEESGTGGGGGAGGGGPVSGPGCDAPAEAPSRGACYPG